MSKENQLADIHVKNKPYIIYKSQNGFDLYTDFSKKILLNHKNISRFLTKKQKKISKSTDLYIGFFGYEILNNLIGIKLPKQKKINFPKGIFYKPEKKLSFSNVLNYRNDLVTKTNNRFKININRKSYTKIFNQFKKKSKAVKLIKLRFAQNIKQIQKLIH